MDNEKKLERLRNLMSPIVNYFEIQGKLETGDYPEGKYVSLNEIYYESNIQSRINIKKIVKILKDND